MDRCGIRCGIFHPDAPNPYVDDDGCILEGVNHDWHVFIDAHTGIKIEWKDDPCSDCDCEGHYCTIYGPLKEKETPNIQPNQIPKNHKKG